MDDAPSRVLIRYQQLVDIARDLASIVDLDILLTRIVQVAAEIVLAEQASILLYEPKKNALQFVAATNMGKEKLLTGIVVPAESIAGWVAQNHQPLIIADAHKDERFYKNVEDLTRYQTRSLIAVPLVSRQNLIGVLEVINKLEGTFSIHDQDTLMALATQAAISIENSRLFQQSDLISELVHELRTPMASVSTIAHLMQRPEIPAAQKNEYAQMIIKEVKRLNELATNFLDLARLEARRAAFQISSFNMASLVEECKNMTLPKAAETNLSLQLEISPNLPLIEADEDKIKQVILNLLSNAVKYNRPGGSVILRVYEKRSSIFVEVQDTGLGIPENEIPRLFEKFFRSSKTENKTPGTGLGLLICKRIVENHGGKIEVQSKLNFGTTFTVQLPIKNPN
jgi:signal transduction histidine kinase